MNTLPAESVRRDVMFRTRLRAVSSSVYVPYYVGTLPVSSWDVHLFL